jgi:hypothetical protein
VPHAAARRRTVLALLTLVALAASLLIAGGGASAQSTGTDVGEPAIFTSTVSVLATPQQVPDEGEPGTLGTFNLRINSVLGTICHDITLRGVTPPFQSPAPTATHIHQGPAGAVGPPVWLFPDAEMADDGTLRSTGCQQRAFPADVADTFSLAEIEANPAGFYVDVHTSAFEAGSVRGQLGAAAPTGGVAAGGGGTSGGVTWLAALAGLGLAVVGGGAVAARPRQATV